MSKKGESRRSVLQKSTLMSGLGITLIPGVQASVERDPVPTDPVEMWPMNDIDSDEGSEYSQRSLISFYGGFPDSVTETWRAWFSVTTMASARVLGLPDKRSHVLNGHHASANGNAVVSFPWAPKKGITLHAFPDSGREANVSALGEKVIEEGLRLWGPIDFILGAGGLINAYEATEDWDSQSDKLSFESDWGFLDHESDLSHHMYFEPSLEPDSEAEITVTAGCYHRAYNGYEPETVGTISIDVPSLDDISSLNTIPVNSKRFVPANEFNTGFKQQDNRGQRNKALKGPQSHEIDDRDDTYLEDVPWTSAKVTEKFGE